MKRIFALFSIFFITSLLFSQSQIQLPEGLPSLSPVHPDPWSLIIFRPENPQPMNNVRCWVKLEDAESGEDVTFTKTTAKYEWVNESIPIEKKNPRSLAAIFRVNRKVRLYDYERSRYLSGGMAMHLNLKKGKYKISVRTPADKAGLCETQNKGDWESNEFFYDTDNPTNVIFVTPTVNDNGFFNGGWHVDYRSPAHPR